MSLELTLKSAPLLIAVLNTAGGIGVLIEESPRLPLAAMNFCWAAANLCLFALNVSR